MSRKAELQAVLGPWATLRDDLDLEVIPDEEWPQWVSCAEHTARENQKWFKIGIARAINELRSKNADGTPRWPSRETLIQHLSKVDEPNRG
jgi:hypothetical protein